MKGNIGNLVRLLLSFAIIILFNLFYFKIFSIFNISFSGVAKEIVSFIGCLLVCVILFIIYSSYIRAGKHKFNKGIFSSIIYSVACFVFLIVVTIVINKLLAYFGHSISYSFKNYFNDKFTLSFILNLIKEVILIPFMLCVVFPLGFSCILKKTGTTCIISGLTYGIIYGILLHTNFEAALLASITPTIIVMLLTYLYKTNNNIWSVMITYSCYVLFGIFLISYIL